MPDTCIPACTKPSQLDRYHSRETWGWSETLCLELHVERPGKMLLIPRALLFLAALILVCGGDRIGCKNEKNGQIDWYINYKLPKLEDRGENTLLGQGAAYAYMVSNSKIRRWRLSNQPISSEDSMLGQTLLPLYDKRTKKNLTFLLYNDEVPDAEERGSSVGHTKGAVVFGLNSGFWLVHSIPKFPSVDSYDYPSNGYENGQSILCITFDVNSLNEIGKQLIYNGPYIYQSQLNPEVERLLDDDVKTLFSEKPDHIRSEPLYRIATLKSQKNLRITSFAKDNQFNRDLYSDLIAAELKTSLYVETWRRGSGGPLDPSCRTKFDVLDVTSISITASAGSTTVRIGFDSTEDHSKWAISKDGRQKWVCIGDINRMASQAKRGGGAECFVSSIVWTAFHSAINSTDSCRANGK